MLFVLDGFSFSVFCLRHFGIVFLLKNCGVFLVLQLISLFLFLQPEHKSKRARPEGPAQNSKKVYFLICEPGGPATPDRVCPSVSMSEGSEKISTVKLSRSRIEKLKNLKRELKVSSLDEVVATLVDDFDEAEEDDAANDEPEEELPSAQKKRKKLVRPPLLSLSAMLERDGMLRYYTGLDKGTVEIVISEIKAIEVGLF